MNDMTSATRAAVVLRAGNRCEYCQLSQAGQEASFHIDHVVPRAAGGRTTPDNLNRWPRFSNVKTAEKTRF